MSFLSVCQSVMHFPTVYGKQCVFVPFSQGSDIIVIVGLQGAKQFRLPVSIVVFINLSVSAK